MKMKILLLIIPFLSILKAQDIDEHIKDAIVKIYSVSIVYNYKEPWNVRTRQVSGSGSIISGEKILTNAHVVENNTYVEVKRYGTTKRVRAKVLFISHQADLAILSVEDKSFFDGVKPLEFDKIPNIQDKVTVYGFPRGGNTLSVTSGIVSRIEHRRYVHGGERFLSIQVDAAINPGNSGGPGISNGKIVGVVMQSLARGQNIGYLVPVVMIKHFLEDIKDGKVDGFASLGIDTQRMESKTLREMYGMDENSSGQLVIKVLFNSTAYGKLKKGDIITKIDGHRINNDGTVEFRHHQYTSYKYYIDLHQLGESVEFEILRDKKRLTLSIPLKYRIDKFLLVKTKRFGKAPSYFIYGGYVFVPLTRNLLQATSRASIQLRDLSSKWVSKEREDVVLVLKVLASRLSQGNYGISMWAVDKFNGSKFATFKEFYKKVEDFQGEYLLLEDSDGVEVAIDTKEAKKRNPQIIKRYGIKYAKSPDLR